MKWLITKADFLGMKPILRINEESRSKSFFSGFISVITCGILLSLTLYFLIQLLTRTDSNLFVNTIPTLEVNRNISSYPYMIGLYTATNATVLGDEYYTLVSQYLKLNTVNGTQILERIPIKQEKCDFNKNFGDYKSYFEKWSTFNNYCQVLDANDLYIKNQFGTALDYYFIPHYFLKCTNNTALNKTNCKPQQEIDSTLQSVYTSMKFLEYSLDHNNPVSAGSLYMRTESNPVSSSISTKIWLYITNVEYNSDLGFLFEDVKKESFFYYS